MVLVEKKIASTRQFLENPKSNFVKKKREEIAEQMRIFAASEM